MAKKKANLKCDDKGQFSTYSEAREEAASYTRQIALLLSPMKPYYCLPHKAYHIGHWRSREDIHAYKAMIKTLYRNGTERLSHEWPVELTGDYIDRISVRLLAS